MGPRACLDATEMRSGLTKITKATHIITHIVIFLGFLFRNPHDNSRKVLTTAVKQTYSPRFFLSLSLSLSLSLRSHSIYHLRPSVFAVLTHKPISVSRCTQTCTSVHYTILVHTGQKKSGRSNPQKVNLHHNTREKYYMNLGRPSAALFTIYGLLMINEIA